MRKTKTLQFLIAVIAIIGYAASPGCDRSENPESALPAPGNGDPDVTPVSKEKQKASDREAKDAGQLLSQVVKEQIADDESQDQENSIQTHLAGNAESVPDSDSVPEKQTIDIPTSWKRLGKKEEIWIDTTAKEVIIAGRVCLNQGPLEMFICPEHTKEHESIIAANATALQVHLALTALGADPGKPTSWDPEYRAAYGPSIKVTLMWQDKETQKTKTAPANQWIRDLKTRKAMEHLWVFGGSQFWEDPETKEQIYYGDSGELICLSNFSTATIDLNVESSQSNEGLLFEAFTENIPAIGTKVYAIIKPGKRIEPASKPNKKAENEATGGNDIIPGTTEASDSKAVDK